MTVLHILPSLDPRYGGPVRSVKGLACSLAQSEVDTVLFVNSPEYGMADEFSKGRFLKGNGMGIKVIFADISKVLETIKPDILHLHGIWIQSNHIAARLARRKNIPYVISPRGMLEPWSLNAKKWKKRLAFWLYQRRDLKEAIALHATADSEAEQLRKLGFKQPIIISPNGVELPSSMPLRSHRIDNKRTVLFLSRIHPKKGLVELVKAWDKIKDTYPNWQVEYAGPDYAGHLGEVQKLIARLGMEADFTYLGDLDDQEKWRAYRRADLFVLPTYSENFGIVVSEALAAGLPVITTKGTPWSELQGWVESVELDEVKGSASLGRCGWWIDIGVEPLVEALRGAMTLTDEERRLMGRNGRRLVEQKYVWPAIAGQMKMAYEWITPGGEVPINIRFI